MAARERLDLWCERGIQGLVLAILCFGPMAFGAVDEAPFAIIELLAAFIGLLWAARFFLNPELKLLWPPVCWAVLAFALYTLWRYRIADIEYVARGEFAHVGVYAFLFLAIVNNLHRQEVTQFVVCAVITLAMLIAGYALYQFVTGSNRVWNVYSPYAHRGTGTYINPNHLGGFLEMVFPLALAFTLLSRFKALPRVLLGYAALVILAGIAVTISRGSWISTALALLLFLFVLLMNRAYRLPALAVLIVVAAGSVFLVQRSHIVQKRAGQLVVNGRIDDDRRFALWKPTIQMWRDNFWWGAGPGHFDYRFREYRPESVQLQPDHAHNDYLNTLADYGIAGSALVAAALALLAAGVFVTWRKVRPSEGDLGGRSGSNKFALVCGASMGLAAILFHSAVDFNLHIPANAILAVTLMALLTGYIRFRTGVFWFRSRPWAWVVAVVLLLSGTAFLGTQGVRQYREARWLARARQLPLSSPAQIEALKRAFQIDPKNGATAYALGEAFRHLAKEGGSHYEGETGGDYAAMARQGEEWFERAVQLNRFDGNAWLGLGWCLDWLGKTKKAAECFARAEALDPNGYYAMFRIGQHYIQNGDFSAAKPWFERSIRLEGDGVRTAGGYLQVANTRMMEYATNDIAARLSQALSRARPE